MSLPAMTKDYDSGRRATRVVHGTTEETGYAAHTWIFRLMNVQTRTLNPCLRNPGRLSSTVSGLG